MGKKIRMVRVIDVTEMGRAGGKATAARRTPEERSRAASAAVQARLTAYYRKHPEKLTTKRPASSRKKKATK